MTLIETFDLQNLLVNTLSGSWLIFIGLALVVFAGLAAKFKMNGYTFGIITILFSIMMIQWAGWVFALIGLIGGLVIYYILGKLGK